MLFSSIFHNAWFRWCVLSCGMALGCMGQTLQAREFLTPRPKSEQSQQWTVVQPLYAAGFRVNSAEILSTALPRELGHAVPIEQSLRGKGVEAMQWSLRMAQQQPSILMLPEEAILIGEGAREHPAHVSHYEPLVVLGFKRWCVFTGAQSTLQSAAQLQEWLKVQPGNVAIALPMAAGRMRVWVQGMAHITQRPWHVQVYGVNGDFAAALAQGADLAIARCDMLGASRKDVRVLVQSGDMRSALQPEIPTFKEVGWMPFDHGWTALFAPKAVPAHERDRIAQALYTVVRSPSMRRALAKGGLITADLSPAASHEHIASFIKAWELVGRFLLGRSFGDLSEMKGPASPYHPKTEAAARGPH